MIDLIFYYNIDVSCVFICVLFCSKKNEGYLIINKMINNAVLIYRFVAALGLYFKVIIHTKIHYLDKSCKNVKSLE